MRKLEVILLCLFVLIGADAYAQQESTETEINKAKLEVAAIDSVISLTASQKHELELVMLEKNSFMSNPEMSISRRNWTIEHNYLERIDQILQDGNNVGKGKAQAKSLKQVSAKTTSKDKPVLDEKLLKRLNLHKVAEHIQ
ncbi:hypothetical protein [Sphingobacterium sp. xlx-130]|uniref:hypothetical protein n=1 Tax=Sphingobacterium sp. xlx-130 TaxID=2654323 RepID=UPI00196A152A|nr:hypothetical protein [Sphingobacterium sp. xlx-130]